MQSFPSAFIGWITGIQYHYEGVKVVSELTQSRLQSLLHYDPCTGVFTWLVQKSSRRKVGDEAGGICGNGYRQIGLDGKLYLTHRLAWLWMIGEWPKDQIDHINGVRDDNRWSNLREATNAENCQNLKINSNNKSGYMGVSWHAKKGKWKAQISSTGCNKYLGQFTSPEDAHAAYLAAKAIVHPFQPAPRAE